MKPRFILAWMTFLLPVASIHAQPPEMARLDLLGDPLPEGAIARLGTLRFKIGGSVSSRLIKKVVFAQDGSKIASLTGQAMPSRLGLWNAATGQHVAGPWDATEFQSTAFAFSPNVTLLAAAAVGVADQGAKKLQAKKQISIWHIASGKTEQTLTSPPEQIQDMVFIDKGKGLITVGNGMVRWWDVASGKEQRSWSTPTRTSGNCLLSPDGKFLTAEILAGSSTRVNVDIHGFDLVKGDLTWQMKGKRTNADSGPRFAYSSDSMHVVIADGSGILELRETGSGKMLASGKMVPKPPNNQVAFDFLPGLAEASKTGAYVAGRDNGRLALSADGKTVAIAGDDGRGSIWAVEGTKLFGKLRGSIAPSGGQATTAIQFSADGKKLAIGAVHALGVYDALTLQEALPFSGHANDVHFVHFSPDGKQLLSGTLAIRNSIYDAWTWDTATWKALSRPKEGVIGLPLISATRSFDQSICAGMDAQKKLGFYDLTSGKNIGTMDVPANQDPFTHRCFSPDCKFFVVVGKDEMGKDVQRLFRAPSGKLVCVLPALGQPSEPLRPLAFSGDGRLVACFSGMDGRIHVFDIESGRLLRQLYEPPAPSKGAKGFTFRSNLAFSSDGKALASWTSADNVVRIWDIATGKDRIILANQKAKFGVLMLARPLIPVEKISGR